MYLGLDYILGFIILLMFVISSEFRNVYVLHLTDSSMVYIMVLSQYINYLIYYK